mgnify:FL=1|jgi:Ni2+-binding GTPase involved in maturation of urease and hydrogenase
MQGIIDLKVIDQDTKRMRKKLPYVFTNLKKELI